MTTKEEVLEQYIEELHQRPFNFFCDNCWTKSIKIYQKAKSLGIRASLFVGFSFTIRTGWLPPLPVLHMWTQIGDRMINVTLNPDQERLLYPNYVGREKCPIRLAEVKK